MNQNLRTRGEMERSLSQHIQAFYRNQLGCRVGKISSYILDDRVAISVEDSITPLEKLLDNAEDLQLRRDLRDRIDDIVKQELMSSIEKILGVQAIDLAINTTLDQNLTGMMVFLSDTPTYRRTKCPSRTRN